MNSLTFELLVHLSCQKISHCVRQKFIGTNDYVLLFDLEQNSNTFEQNENKCSFYMQTYLLYSLVSRNLGWIWLNVIITCMKSKSSQCGHLFTTICGCITCCTCATILCITDHAREIFCICFVLFMWKCSLSYLLNDQQQCLHTQIGQFQSKTWI